MITALQHRLGAFLSQNFINHLSILLALLLQLAGLAFAIGVDSYVSRKHKRILRIILLLVLALVVQNYAEYLLASEGTGMPRIYYRTVVAILGYSIRPVILLLFFYVIEPDRKYTAAWVLAGVNVAVHCTALFGSRICFHIGEQNNYTGGPLNKCCMVVSLLFLANLLLMTVRKYSSARMLELNILVFIILMLLISLLLDGSVGAKDQVVEYVTITSVSSSVFFYIWLHLQFVREHEKELRDGQRLQIMLSQIKPHFLYNSLGAIEELCESDPKMAREATVLLSRYLRGNMQSLSTTGTISFEEELAHTKLYLQLEQIRFEDALQVVYDIACTDFSLPPLTLEPLAENAVRHGVRGSVNGRGTVVIAAREYPDHIEVSVMDDGPGFDPEAKPEDGRDHIGLQNVRERLMQVCGGTLRIESHPGAGTTATILLWSQNDQWGGKQDADPGDR